MRRRMRVIDCSNLVEAKALIELSAHRTRHDGQALEAVFADSIHAPSAETAPVAPSLILGQSSKNLKAHLVGANTSTVQIGRLDLPLPKGVEMLVVNVPPRAALNHSRDYRNFQSALGGGGGACLTLLSVSHRESGRRSSYGHTKPNRGVQ